MRIAKNKVLSEINTIHSFGAQGRESNGWPFRPSGTVGFAVGPYIYRNPRATQNELGGSVRNTSRRRRKSKTRTRRHATQSLGAR